MKVLSNVEKARDVYSTAGWTGLLGRGSHYGLDLLGNEFEFADYHLRERSDRILSKLQETEITTSDVVRTPYLYRGYGHYRGITPNQIQEEIERAAERFNDHDPDTVVEIGTASGGTLYVWSRLVHDAAHVISIDFSLSERQQEFFSAFGPALTDFVVGNSHSTTSKQRVEKLLNGSEIDFLFIDGHGAYDSVKADFEMYQPLLSDDAMVVFHDIERPSTDDHGVQDFWHETESRYRSEKITEKPHTRAGIGIIYMSS